MAYGGLAWGFNQTNKHYEQNYKSLESTYIMLMLP